MMKKNIIIISLVLLMIVGINPVSASMRLDNIFFDPAIIAAGDEVDIVVEFHNSYSIDDDRANNPDYSFKVEVVPDDSLTQRYVLIQDAFGDDLHGTVYSGDYYNKKFRVKIAQDAPAGSYEFKLLGRWYEDGEPLDGESYIRFKMDVKKEGVVIGIGSLTTVPAEVRPGDDFVLVSATVVNSGEKAAKTVELTLISPDGLVASYTNNNRVWVGYLASGDSRDVSFYLDVDDYLVPQVYDLRFKTEYSDVDNNNYQSSLTLPFFVKPRPYLEVIDVKGEGIAGSSSKLYVTLKNTGSEDAESVDVRFIKQSAQPFSTDVRSDYIGVLAPGATGTAVFTIGVSRDAELKDHDITLLVRAKGDSDAGDDNIYSFNRHAVFKITSKAPNNLLYVGIAGFVIVILVSIVAMVRRK